MQRGDFASGGWQKLIETLLTGLMQPSAHEVPSKTPDVRFWGSGHDDCTVVVRYWHLADIPLCTAHVRFRG